MKLILSPAKKMRIDRDFLAPKTKPEFLEKTGQLLSYLRSLSLPALKKLLCCNESLAKEAYGYFQKMELDRGETPALFSYDGIQYKYMAPGLMTDEQLDYVEEHVRILSGFYGILRPFDGISPYRLELQAKVRTDFCGNLYQFWGNSLANWLLREDPVIVNLASEEYAKAVRPYVREQGRFVTCLFAEEEQPGQLVEKGVYVKMARGEMARWAAERKAETPEELREFDRLGYVFDRERSERDLYLFTRKEVPGKKRRLKK